MRYLRQIIIIFFVCTVHFVRQLVVRSALLGKFKLNPFFLNAMLFENFVRTSNTTKLDQDLVCCFWRVRKVRYSVYKEANMTCVIVLQDAIPPPCNILYIFMVKQPGKPFLLIDNPRILPVTQLNVPVANLLKFILGSKAERYKANSFLLFYSP